MDIEIKKNDVPITSEEFLEPDSNIKKKASPRVRKSSVIHRKSKNNNTESPRQRKFSMPNRTWNNEESEQNNSPKHSDPEPDKLSINTIKTNDNLIISPRSPQRSPKDTVRKLSVWNTLRDKLLHTPEDSVSSPRSSPRLFRSLTMHRNRNDSNSSGDSSLTPTRHRKKFNNRLSWRGSEDYDTVSVDSFHVSERESPISSPTTDVDKIFPNKPFELWAEGKTNLDIENPSLPLLHVASADGNMKLLETLTDIGVDLNEEDANGWTALHYAVCSGHFESARFLLEKGANIHSYTNKVMNNYCTTVREFIRSSDDGSR